MHSVEVDLHRLELRFASSRLVEPRAVARIADSIERCGQIVPCIVVAVPGPAGAGGERLVLIDGYRRFAALRRLGRDTAGVERWTCDVTEALLGLLARTQNRPLASIEEALLMRELMQGLGLSQHDLARRCGRDVSWVSRRLHLLSGLPDAALAAVRDGKLSSWAASRIVVPLARANTEHADRLLTALIEAPLQANREQRADERLRAGPEGEYAADLRCIEAILARLRKRVAALRPLPLPLIAAIPRLRAAIDALINAIQRDGADDPDRDP